MANTVQVVTRGDIGEALAVVDGKLNVQVDGTTVKIVGNQLVATQGVELHVTKAVADKNTGKFIITVADAEGGNVTELETSLADLIVLSQADGNLAEAKDDGIYVGKPAVQEAAKQAADVEFQSLGGTTLGYGFSTNA